MKKESFQYFLQKTDLKIIDFTHKKLYLIVERRKKMFYHKFNVDVQEKFNQKNTLLLKSITEN